jgi:hypothetical protein
LTIPKRDKIGFERYAAEEPVIANTRIMTKTCQFDLIFQRSLKLDILLFFDKYNALRTWNKTS